jgi:hypothetical protein
VAFLRIVHFPTHVYALIDTFNCILVQFQTRAYASIQSRLTLKQIPVGHFTFSTAIHVAMASRNSKCQKTATTATSLPPVVITSDAEVADVTTLQSPCLDTAVKLSKTFTDVQRAMMLHFSHAIDTAGLPDVAAVGAAEANITALVATAFTKFSATLISDRTGCIPASSFDVEIDIAVWPLRLADEVLLVKRLVDACPFIQRDETDISVNEDAWCSGRPWPDCVVLTIELYDTHGNNTACDDGQCGDVFSMTTRYGLKK